MSNHETWQITVQPWRLNSAVSVRVSRATYTTTGRQKWELIAAMDARPGELTDVLDLAAVQVEGLHHAWRKGLTDQLELPSGDI